MTAVQTPPRTQRSGSQIRPIPFVRLVATEWRKQLDTRAGRWLLIVIAILVAGLLAIQVLTGDEFAGTTWTFEAFIVSASSPMMMLLPIVAILSATAEWSQRTGLVTFTLEPRRMRVVWAKVVTAVGSGVAFFVASVGIAALAHLWVVTFQGAEAAWSLDAALVAGLLIVVLIAMVQGVAFGLALLNTPAAIVLYLAVPTIVGILVVLVPAWNDVWPWIELGSATQPLFGSDDMTRESWLQVASSSAIWVGIPLLIGALRVKRGEIKTA